MTSTATPQAGRDRASGLRAPAPAQARRRRRDWWGYLFVLPALAVYVAFALRPIGETAYTSLFEWDGLTLATWVGFGNYTELFESGVLQSTLGHSLVFLVFYALLPTAVGLVIAGLMTRIRIRGLALFRSVLFIPQILSSVVIAVAWRWIYDLGGPLNAVLDAVGLGALTRAWLGDFDTALVSVGLIGTWVQFGLCMMLFLAGAQRIPRELYESARIDGAGAIREFFVVTVPGLRTELRIALVLTTIFALRNFDIVWNTTAGGPGTSTTVPSVYVYEGAFLTREVGDAAAVAVVLTLFILVVVGALMAGLRDRDAAR